MNLRDHAPIVIDTFNGLWKRGQPEDTPLDHFQDCNNIRFSSGGDVLTRDGITPAQNVQIPLANIKRIYNFPTQTANTLIVLTYDNLINIFHSGQFVPDFLYDEYYDEEDIFLNPSIHLQESVKLEDNSDNVLTQYPNAIYNRPGTGRIYHVVNSTLTYGPILTIEGMTDFAFIPYAGRGYISPFSTFNVGGLNVEKGLQGEFIYVYAGDGTSAQKAAGDPLIGTLTIANGAAGHTDPGFHIFGFVAETVSGYLTPPGALGTFTTIATNSVSFGTVPIYGPRGTKRHLVASKVIANYNGNPEGYTLYFVPGAVIDNNTDIFLNDISFFDADLIDNASHLFNNYSEIPASAVLTTYHNRLCALAQYDNISLGLISHAGEPEAISQINGLIVFPLDGNPITNAAELRDILYVMKRSRTVGFTDDGSSEPSAWVMSSIDNSLGTCVHGIATVLDSGSSNVDYLMVATYQGITLFNGRYITPELSWKIEDYWVGLDRNNFRLIQIVNAPIQKEIYIVLPNGQILVGNYSAGLDPKKIKWGPWSYNINIVTVAVWQIDQILIGADLGNA